MSRSIREAASAYKRRLGQKLLHSPLHPLYQQLAGSPQVREYRHFVEALARCRPSPEELKSQLNSWQYRPRISILMAVRNPKPEWLRQAVGSVTRQVYPYWDLCVCDDASDDPGVLTGLPNSDPRISVAASKTRLGISGALNRALADATGEYVTVLDHDDFLSDDALFRVVEAMQHHRPGLLYSDEEYVNEAGRPMRPNFKPDWSPELLSNCMYVGHLVVASRELMLRAGGFRGDFDGAQDYDLVLRLTDNPVEVAHVPYILYHWRQHKESIARSSAAKPWADDAGRRAAEDMVRRRGWDARVLEAEMPTRYRIVRNLARAERATVILTGRSSVKNATDYGDVEFIQSDRTSGGKNAAASRATGTYLVFLDAGVSPSKPDWLTVLLAQAQRHDVGAVGAMLVGRNGVIRHSGIVAGMLGGVGHPGRGLYQSDYWRWVDFTRNVTAVSSTCLAIRRDVFQAVGGFDGSFTSDFADADLCLRLRASGYQSILEQRAAMVIGGRQEGHSASERERFRAKWQAVLDRPDPYYSRYLRLDKEDTSLSASGGS